MTQQRRAGLTWVELCVILGIISLTIALLLPAVQSAREQARKSSWKNNLKSIGLALHNYHDDHRCFPPGGIIREDDTAMHGWMMMIMPYLDANPLSVMIDYDQPWDHPVNVPVFKRSIHYYMMLDVDLGLTSEGHSLTQVLGNPNLMHRNSQVGLKELNGEAAHNWLAGEIAGNYQPWGYPFNWRPLGTKLCDGPESFGHPAWDGGHLLLVDGRVSFFSDDTSPEILRRLANAPPVASREETAVPDHIFQLGNFYWKRFDLQSDPHGKNKYLVQVLRNPAGTPLQINVYVTKRFTPEELTYYKTSIEVLHLLSQITPSTDVASTLKATTLAEATSPAQFETNVKMLQTIQRRLPKTNSHEVRP
ncbi:hypothetical protein Pan241w_08380 [Gimesia alba]|uniref:DUF1559 domain-containing protein n=1 Tax=Gimesia alba TaxID=2527973 RepID=A0A517RA70_9PLAN|nr:DUF1559 domain-containing protein [Gimesia alba]QDT40779.1 hypothetical protein Pan241w_08380 [Gimesia alba]